MEPRATSLQCPETVGFERFWTLQDLVWLSAQKAFPFEVSADYDLFNQGSAVKYFEDLFYEPSGRHQAYANPVLALAGAQVLYMFAWFRSSGEILRANVASAAELFERSIFASPCQPENEFETEPGWSPTAQLYARKSEDLFQGIKRVKRYSVAAEDVFGQLMQLDPSREHLATPGGWDTLRIVRYHHWYDIFCQLAPETCELIKTRPEINECKFMNVRLNPGTHLKPHYGNGPRLSAHLSVKAPEPMKAALTVADQRRLWVEGEAIVFDDTYPHMVSHWGEQPRYVPGSAGERTALEDGPLLDDSERSNLKVEEEDDDDLPELVERKAFEGKRWMEPQKALEAVRWLVSGQSASLGPSRPAPPFGLGVTCRVLGFWGSSGEEIREELRWDGTQYLCSLEDLVDFGRLPKHSEKTGYYMAMSKSEPCLDILLRGQLHIHDPTPQILGRISWPVVAGMGLRLLRTLEAIHLRGIIHCDLKPGNVLLHRRAPHVQLIDLGRAGDKGRTSFEPGQGGMRDYMSIKSGLEGGRRTSADDVESLGARVAREKLRFLEEGGLKRFAPECRFCPPFLMSFLRRARSAAGHELAPAEYDALAELLVKGTDVQGPLELESKLEQWVSGYYAARDAGILKKGMWPYAGVCTLHWLFVSEGPPAAKPSLKRLQVCAGLVLRLTGEKVEIDERIWMELDPLWSPGLPDVLLKPGWVLAVGPPPTGAARGNGADVGVRGWGEAGKPWLCWVNGGNRSISQ
eukprot:g26395.t1